MLRRWRSLMRLTPGRRALFAEALVNLSHAWFLVRTRPFDSWSHRLGTSMAADAAPAAYPPMPVLRDVRWAARKVNRMFGGRFTCLMMAMAGKAMLNRRHVPNDLVLGVRLQRDASSAANPIAAHAWLCVGDIVLLGDEERPGHVPIASYRSAWT